MATQNEHGKLIAAAAKAALAPIGCKRRGQSGRRWMSDEGFYAIVIEFQPSGWSKGSYLNVGACCLWRAEKGWTFDHGYRKGDFISFESPERFMPLVAAMAARAAAEVLILREQFRTVADAVEHLDAPKHLRLTGKTRLTSLDGVVTEIESVGSYPGWWTYHALSPEGSSAMSRDRSAYFTLSMPGPAPGRKKHPMGPNSCSCCTIHPSTASGYARSFTKRAASKACRR